MRINALHNHIIFKFIDEVNVKGEFVEAAHKSGIILKGGFDKSAKKPRWATVLKCGVECEHVQVGDLILMPALRWTEGAELDGERFWKTDEKQLVGYKRNAALTLLNKYITFKAVKETVTQNASGLFVVSHTPLNTPSGKVLDIAAECEADLKQSVIYYDSSNFFDDFELNGEEISFMKEDDILLYVKE